MLKKLLLNQKTIPVPVPVTTLEEALVWVEQTFMNPREVITKVVLDGSDLSEDMQSGLCLQALRLSDSSKLEVQVDSPNELALQTLDAISNLVGVVERGLKPLAVRAWQALPSHSLDDWKASVADLELVVELSSHLSELVDGVDISITKYLVDKLSGIVRSLKELEAEKDRKNFAKMLLNKLEPLLKEIKDETVNLQVALYSSLSAAAMVAGK